MNQLCPLNTAGAENFGLILDEHDVPLANSSDHLLLSTPSTVNPESFVLGSNFWDPSSPQTSDIYNYIRLPAPALYESQLVLSKTESLLRLGACVKTLL
jgi:hypothetical protein